jgi:hypothetical protein
MRVDGRMILAASMGAIVVSLAACDGSQPAHAADAVASTQCEAPEVGAALRDALCKGGAPEIREALFSIDSKPGEASRDRLLTVLKRLWKGDKSYGNELPWPALESVQSRAVFADYLAQGVRNTEIEAPLVDMQRFAAEMVQGAQRDVDQLEGLRLLGVTDAQDQVPLLRSIAFSTEGPAVRRRYAIEALGYICASEAAATLREVEQTFGERDLEVRKAVEKAQQARARLSSSWCRDSTINTGAGEAG